MNKLALGAAMAALSLALPGVAQAQRAPGAVIVVVDTDRIYRDCTACKAANTQLQSLLAAARTRSQTLGQPLQTEAQAIEAASNALRNQTGGARTTAETALNTRMQAFRAREAAAQQELAGLERNIQSTQQNVLRQINARLTPAVNQVMTARGANVALDTNARLTSAPALDVTNDVLTALNASLPSVSVTPLPQAQQPAQPQPQGR